MTVGIDGDNGIDDGAGGPVTLVKQWASKAWVNFNGTGTVTIRDNENVSSITDNGTGDYSINLTNSMTDANYSGATTGSVSAASNELANIHTLTASIVSVKCGAPGSAAAVDFDIVLAQAYGNLA